jgi:AcrR family transcriptional regulator
MSMSPASERSPSSRGESKGEATRARIIQRALELATRVGLEGLSIGDLAQDLGLSKSGLFAHFGSKEQLQLDVLDAAAELFRAVVFDPVMRGAVGQARLVALFENILKWVQARDLPGGCIFMAGAFEWDDAQGPVRQRMVEWFEKLNGSITRTVAAAVEQGEFRADLDAELFAYELHSISLKYHLEARLLRSKKALTLARRAFQRLLADARA